MLGLGLSLTVADFKRVVVYPRAVVLGLFCQMLLLPLGCYAIAVAFRLPPELAVGLMLLSASPGGATANLYSHLARGDVALNVTLTAVNSVLSVFTLPLIVEIAMRRFLSEAQRIPLQFEKVVQVFAIVLVPVLVGMVIRRLRPAFAFRLHKPVKIFSAVVLVLVVLVIMVVGATDKSRASDTGMFMRSVLPALTFNVASMAIGYFVPLLARVPRRQAVAIGMEIGIHNGTLAIALATGLLKSTTMAIPAAVYSGIMFFTAGIFGYVASRKLRDEPRSVVVYRSMSPDATPPAEASGSAAKAIDEVPRASSV
ncbi:MAG: bile acid:sodium symporter family protein [Polyangiaceae bacterium]|nr:bile acid:sodium symporter family protein [Polyangiaceae bacterium]